MNKQIFSIKKAVSFRPEQFSEEHTKALYKRYIPANVARRCGQLSKMALAVSAQVLENSSIDYAIFCSQHGELECALSLLQDLSCKELLSPTRFVRSVHNTASGIFSITNKMQQNMTSIAAGENSFLMGMVDALAWLKLHPETQVLLTAFDDHIPSVYQPLGIHSDHQYASAFILTRKNTHLPTLYANMADDSDQQLTAEEPDALSFYHWLSAHGEQRLTQGAGRPRIIWEKLAS